MRQIYSSKCRLITAYASLLVCGALSAAGQTGETYRVQTWGGDCYAWQVGKPTILEHPCKWPDAKKPELKAEQTVIPPHGTLSDVCVPPGWTLQYVNVDCDKKIISGKPERVAEPPKAQVEKPTVTCRPKQLTLWQQWTMPLDQQQTCEVTTEQPNLGEWIEQHPEIITEIVQKHCEIVTPPMKALQGSTTLVWRFRCGR